MKFLNKTPGFTLLELLAVIAIMAMLVTISVPVYQDYSARARASEIVQRFDAMRTNVATSIADGPVENCNDLTGLTADANLGQDYGQLALGFETMVAGNAHSGFRPVLTLCARNEVHGEGAIRVVRAAMNELSNLHLVEAGAVVTDSVISFAVPLADQPACRLAGSITQANCGGGQTPSQPSQSSTVQSASNGQPAQPPAPAIPQTPAEATAAVDTAVASLPDQDRQAVATVFSRMTADPTFSEALAQAMASGDVNGMPGDNYDQSELESCGLPPTLAFSGTDSFLGDCGTDFNGMCGDCFVKEYCAVSCGISKPSSPEVAAALAAKHYQETLNYCSYYRNHGQADHWTCGELAKLQAGGN